MEKEKNESQQGKQYSHEHLMHEMSGGTHHEEMLSHHQDGAKRKPVLPHESESGPC